jgi:hypothetical protein
MNVRRKGRLGDKSGLVTRPLVRSSSLLFFYLYSILMVTRGYDCHNNDRQPHHQHQNQPMLHHHRQPVNDSSGCTATTAGGLETHRVSSLLVCQCFFICFICYLLFIYI